MPSLTSVAHPNAALLYSLRQELKEQSKKGHVTFVEELLKKCPDVHFTDDELLDLIYQELVLREEIGEKPTLDEYRQRFPSLHGPLERQFAMHEMVRSSQIDAALKATLPMSAAEIHQAAAIGKFGTYVLLDEIGRGGMGVVFKARDEKLNRTVALKLLQSPEYASAEQRQRFKGEAEIVAQLQHPNIVQVFDVGEQDGVPYFAMEFVAGRTLQHRMRESPLDPAAAARLVQTLASAVHVAHQRGIIHRDLKPSNVLMTEDMTPKITDFGLARQGDSELTTTGAVLGTPSYMSPEQALGQHNRMGPSTDIYSLGAILFELFTGRAPFRGATVHLTLKQVIGNEPPAPRGLQPGVPRDLETICLKCLQKEPSKRYESAKALADDLGRFLKGEPIQARPIGRAETFMKWVRREPKVAALLAAVLFVLVTGLVVSSYLWLSERSANQKYRALLYPTHIRKANDQLNLGNVARAEEALAECPEMLRDWEWRYLKYRCKHPLDSETIEAPGVVTSLAAHPTKALAVVGFKDGRLAFLANDDRLDTPLQAHLGDVNALAFAPDGSAFFSGGDDGMVYGWNTSTKTQAIKFTEHEGAIGCIAVHPSAPWIASSTLENGDDVGIVRIWNRDTGKTITSIEHHKPAVVSGLAFHPRQNLVATASHDKRVLLCDCETGKIVRAFVGHEYEIASVSISPDGTRLASTAGLKKKKAPNYETIVWDIESGKQVWALRGNAGRSWALAFSPDGNRLATAGGYDNKVILWDMKTGEEVFSLFGSQSNDVKLRDGFSTLAFDVDGSLLAGNMNQTLRRWRTKPGT